MNAPDSGTQRQLETIARGGALNLLGAIVSAAATFLLVVVVARTVDQDTAGSLFATTSAMLILIAVAALGTDTGLGRFLLRYEATDRHRDIDTLLRVALAPVMSLTVVLAAIVLVFAEPLADLLGLDAADGPAMLRIMAAALPFASLNDFALATTRAFGKMRPTVLVDRFGRSVLQTAGLLIVGLAGGGPAALMMAWSAPYALAAVASTAMALRILRRRLRAQAGGGAAHDRATIRRDFWRFTWPRSIARVCQQAIQRADIVLIAALLGVDDAAVYTAATRFVVLGQFVVIAIVQVLQPRFTELLARDELTTVREVFKIATAWSIALAWPLYVGVAAGATSYLRVFGSSYADDGIATVVVMAVAMMFASAAGPLDTLLLMAGGSVASLMNAGVAVVVDITLCLVLIPQLGISGAAIAWGAAVATRNALTWLQVQRLLFISPLSRAGAIAASAAVMVIGAPTLLAAWAFDGRPGPVAGAWLLAASAYLAVLWTQRGPLAFAAFRRLGRRRPSPIPAAG